VSFARYTPAPTKNQRHDYVSDVAWLYLVVKPKEPPEVVKLLRYFENFGCCYHNPSKKKGGYIKYGVK